MSNILTQPPTDYERLRGSTDYRGTYSLMFDYDGMLTEISGNAFQTLTWKNRYGRVAYW